MASTLHGKVNTQPVLFAKVWQHPYVDVFRQLGVFDGKHSRISGDVKRLIDPTLNKQVLSIKGSVSAANYLELPGPGTTQRERERNPAAAKATALGLTGEYMYMQLRAVPDRFFVIHIDVATTQGLVIRLSISNIFKFIKLSNHGRVLQLPCDFLSSKWTVLALHFPSLLEECSNNVQSMHAFADGEGAAAGAQMKLKYSYSSITRMQFCSTLFLKTVLTSSHRYGIGSLPREVRFFVGKGFSFDDFYEWFWIITPPAKKQEARERSILQEEEDEEAAAQAEAEGETDEERQQREAMESHERLRKVGSALPITAIRSQAAPAEAVQKLWDPSGRAVASPLKSSVPVHVHSSVDVQRSPQKQAQEAAEAAARSAASSSSSSSSHLPHSDASQRPLTAAEFDDPAAPSTGATSSAAGRHGAGAGAGALRGLVGGVGAAADATVPDHKPVQTRIAQAWVSEDQKEYSDSAPSGPQPTQAESDLDPSIKPAGSALHDSALHPDPILSLDKIIGYTSSRTSRNLCWSPCGQYMLYPSNNVLVIANVKTGQQEFLTGHTANIHLVSIASNGILATGQEGKQALIRLWNFETRQCVGILMAHNSDLRCISFSYMNLMLGAVGRDAQGRILIVIWDISAVLQTGVVHIVAKQLSDYGINRLMFSPFREDPLHLISCGHESIRFWRIKTKHCPGSSLQLNEHARNTFTDLAFEAKYGEADHTSKRMYVATAAGSLFQINYATRALECIYKLHSGPIYSLSVNEGFCVTGSGDCFLRVWPLDFSDYFLQAQHKGAISAVQISSDGLHVLVGSENGCIGVMDLSSTAYQTRIRSHLDTIYGVAFDPHRDEFCTVSKDGTIRVFGAHSLEQIYEFYGPHESVHCVAYHPLESEYRVACGFSSGSVRVMDIATTTMHVDYQQHTGRVLDVLFSNDGCFLYSAGEDGNVCAYDVHKNYLPIRMFTTYRHQPVPLPPSVNRTLQSEQERQEKLSAQARKIKAEHEERAPFLSHHLDRARAERDQLLNPTPANHSHSHARHCMPGGDHAHGSSVVPHSHASHHPAAPAILPAHALAINSDGTLLATLGADPTSVVLLSTDTLRQVRLLSSMSLPVAKLLFSPHAAELCVVLSDSSFQRFGLAEGNLIAHVTASPTMKFKQERAAAAPTREVGLVVSASGAVSVPNTSAVCTSATLSPLNLYLLTGSSEPLLRVWDYHSKPHAPHFQSLLAHYSPLQPQEGVTSLTFSPDGRKLISTGGDAIWIWKLLADEAAIVEQRRRAARRGQEEEQRMLMQDQRRNSAFEQAPTSGFMPYLSSNAAPTAAASAAPSAAATMRREFLPIMPTH